MKDREAIRFLTNPAIVEKGFNKFATDNKVGFLQLPNLIICCSSTSLFQSVVERQNGAPVHFVGGVKVRSNHANRRTIMYKLP